MSTTAIFVGVVVLATSFADLPACHGFSSPSPSPPNSNSCPPRPPPRQTPDERQAAMLKSMGYVWNGRSWVRGDAAAYAERRASVRSGNRFARFVDANGDSAGSDDAGALAASKRLEEMLSAARIEAMATTEKSRARDRDFKNFAMKREAPFVWFGAELVVFVVLSLIAAMPLPSGGFVRLDWSAELHRFAAAPTSSILCGIAAGAVVALCRSEGRFLQPGAEEPDGKLVRALADSIDGNFALPSPHHVRYGSDNWRSWATLGEIIAAINVTLLLQGFLQPALLRILSDAVMWRLVDWTSDVPAVGENVALVGAAGAALGAAFPALLRGIRHASGPLDGIPAEIEAAERAKQGAGAYFNMSPPRDGDPLEAARALECLAGGWLDKFGPAVTEGGAGWKQPLLAFGGSLACGAAWQLSGGSLVAPFVARCVGALDTYYFRMDAEECRANVKLPALEKRT